MKSIRTKQFHKLYAQLPSRVQDQARVAYQQFKENPHHASLHFKRISTQRPIYSVRVGRSYRAVGKLEGETITGSGSVATKTTITSILASRHLR